MAQRYAILRPSTDDDDRLRFWIGDSSFLGRTTDGVKFITYSQSWIFCWLTPNHPIPNDRCEDVDVFKYGLESNFPAYASKNTRALGREGIIKRHHSRTLNYAWGLVRAIFTPRRSQ